MTEHEINTVEGVLETIEELITYYTTQSREYEEKGLEKMSISYNGSTLSLKLLKARILGEEEHFTWK